MVWITMSLAPHAGNKKRKKSDTKPVSQINKCLNEKRRREQENIHIEELAELVSASPSDMSSLSCKPDKCAILKETVNQIRSQKQSKDNELCDLQESEVSSSKPTIITNQIYGSLLLEAIEGFIFIVNFDGRLVFVSENITSYLKFNQEEVNEKSVYPFIHPDDRSNFQSVLLLMMPLGNGRDWNSENSSGKPTKYFNCRFLVKEEPDNMENKPPLEPHYENLAITANFLPLNDSTNDDLGNAVSCVARRLPVNDVRNETNVEQFTTRIDRQGKVLDLDASSLLPSYGQCMHKRLVGKLLTDFSDPSDVAALKQHLKDVYETDHPLTVLHKFQVAEGRYTKIKTKSRRFHCKDTLEEFVISTHSVIRECDTSNSLEINKSVPSPASVASTSSGPGSVSDSSTSINGSIVLSPMALSNSYGNFASSLGSQNNSDYVLSDLVLDMFPGNNWSMDQGSSQSKGSDNTGRLVSSPLSNRSDPVSGPAPSPTNSAFVLPSSRSGSTAPSPAVQSRAPTPYGGSCYSPSGPQPSPSRASQPDQSNQKLRNLLTQNSSGSDEVQVLMDSSRARPVSNVILRDLLNQEEDCDMPPVEPLPKEGGAVPNPMLNAGSCKTMENSAQQRLGNNNMLRKLLNNDDSDRNFRKHPDLIHQLLISNPSVSNKGSLQNDRLRPDLGQNLRNSENTLPKQMAGTSNRGVYDMTYGIENSALKRKANDKPQTAAKKPSNGANHTQLAGSNPMLASMLAQTAPPPQTDPRTGTQIMTQLPQERLPKNLEKKLIHTPVQIHSTASANPSTSQHVFTSSTTRDVVTSDARGHVLQVGPGVLMQQQQQRQMLFNRMVNSADETTLLAKSLSSMQGSEQVQSQASYRQMTQVVSSEASSSNLTDLLNDINVVIGSPHGSEAMQPVSQPYASDPLLDGIVEDLYNLHEDHKLGEVSNDRETILKKLIDNIEPPPLRTTISTPVNTNTAQDIHEKIAINAIQKQLMEIEPSVIGSGSVSVPNTSVIPTYSQAGQSLTQAARTPQLTLNSAQLTSEQILLIQQQQQLLSGSLPPNYNLVTSRVRLPISTQANVNNISSDILAQVAQRRSMQAVRNVTVGSVGFQQIQKAIKQKAYLQQQQKQRLLEQQQKQQMTMQTQQPLEITSTAGSNTFPENMNDLLNNTVAPNVTLLRSSGIPEVPGSARFKLNSASSLPSPTSQPSPSSAQLSPGQQRVNQQSPFSPQPFPSQTPPPSASYQPPPSYPQKGPSQSPGSAHSPHMVLSPSVSPQPQQWSQQRQQNLQLQNPMLNAQLSQGANRLTLQQRQQLALRSAVSPTSVQTIRGNAVFSSQSDTNFSSLSPAPVMVIQSQAPQQQRVQRTRMASGSNQPNYSTNESMLSPQSLPSPSFSSSIPTTPTSTFVSVSSTGVPVSYSLASVSQHFNFDRQNIQSFSTSPNDNLRSMSNDQGTSVSLPQEIRNLVNSQNHLLLSSNNNQQLVQSLPSGSVTRVLNVQSLTRETLEELGLSVELLPGEMQSGNQSLYAQALLNDANSLENSVPPASPVVQIEEPPKPADQKKSLLQQLLSEPT